MSHIRSRFWWSCEQYRLSGAEAERSALATQIWQRHLADGASDPVNVDAAALRAVSLRLHQTPPPQDLFLQVYRSLVTVVQNGTSQKNSSPRPKRI